MLSYLLWKGRERRLACKDYLPDPVTLNESGRAAVCRTIWNHARRAGLSADQKDHLLATIAGSLAIDYEELCRKRILHLMNLDEARELAANGVDIQLHTHRHRVSRTRELFLKEIEDNRHYISVASPNPAVHFCYPGGFHLPEFEEFLRAAGVESATTCKLDLAHWRSSPFFLPRLLDVSGLTATEFTAWVSGLARFLPQRAQALNESQLLEYTPPD
jgi:hypothetical protein